MNLLKLLQKPKLWLLGIAVSLIGIHLSLVGKTAPTFFLGTSILFWLSVVSRLWEKRRTLSLNSGVFSRFFGMTLIILVIVKILSLNGYDPFLRIFPLISALGLGLIASGIKKLKQYCQEFILLIVLAVPPELITDPINQLIGVSSLTGKFSSFVLWYLGYEVLADGDFIIQPKGKIWISPECAGLTTLLWLLQLSALFLIVFPLEFGKKILVPIVAVITGFAINGLRIAYLAVLAFSDREAFNYWHSQNSQIFSLLSVLLIGIFCLWLIKQEESEDGEDDAKDAGTQRHGE
ncbi:cyanoexosortase A [Microseira sp. BLCC-F43]|jgi:cyanoexosortase A|uniref:cyanoexosortase A n=1 Tax=Microseira sp. BLCC-F43 TaxID=3153602 RepID=UPI0035B72376